MRADRLVVLHRRGDTVSDWIDWLHRVPVSFSARCRIPRDLASVRVRGEEAPAGGGGVTRAGLERIWSRIEDLYRTGTHPAIQLCIRHRGRIVLHRAIGHASGNGPGDGPDVPKRPITLETPINIFSASKAVTAMVIHKLDEKDLLRIDDRVCEYIPGFERHGKRLVTIRHVLAHRAGLPSLPVEHIDLDLLSQPERIVELLCEARPVSRPGRLLAYHAVTGGFILAEVARRAAGKSLREILAEEISGPLGTRWLGYGVRPQEVGGVATNYFTGPPVPPPLAQVLRRALGASTREITRLSNDPRFLTAVIPSANVFATAEEMSRFYQCLLDEGAWGEGRVFAPRTVRHATAEQSWWEIDFTLGLPLRYGLGFMLGNRRIGLFGYDNPQAFGHLGLSNVLTWADPQREIAVALLDTGKPVASLHVIPLFAALKAIAEVFPKQRRREGTATARS